MLGKDYILKKSTRANKRYMLVTPDGKSIHFGSNGSAYIDHGNNKVRANYIKRHKVNENWNEINPGSLSRYILWEKKSLDKAISEYEKKFKIKIINLI